MVNHEHPRTKIVPRLVDKSQLGDTNPDAPTLESALQIHINAGRFPSTRIFENREKCSRSWRLNINSHSDAHRITYWPERISTNIRNANRSTCHVKYFHNQKLRRPHCDVSRKKPTTWHTLSRSIAGISKKRATKLIVPLPSEFTRVARKCSQSWRLDQPLQCGTKYKSDTNRVTYSSERNSSNIQNKNRWTGHQNVLHTTHRWRPHRDGPGAKKTTTWLHPPSRDSCKKKTTVGRFTSNICADRFDMFAIVAALDQPTPMWCLIKKINKRVTYSLEW